MTYTTIKLVVTPSCELFMDYILLFLNDIHNTERDLDDYITIVYGLYFTFFE